jgi:molybdopterin/thiamine biosynthesis adenylyltransferase
VLAKLPVGKVITANINGTVRKYNTLFVINSITLDGTNTWQDTSLPEALTFEQSDYPLSIVRLAAEESLPPTNAESFRARCAELLVPADRLFIAFLKGTSVSLYLDMKNSEAVTSIAIVPAQPEKRRLSESHDVLATKTVGLVGCGSIGSKIGISLARTGVCKFVLLDDDILFAHNLVRNDLDWRDVGSHKSEALRRRIQLVNTKATARSRELQLGGQESSSFASTALNLLTECDLIIDATANPDAFNLISAIAVSARKPVVWAEVFAGGTGGLIARSRPGLDPSPQYARRSIENWFEQSGASPSQPAIDYGLETEIGPMIADDGDVSAIAAHAVRLAIDTLIARQPSLFPFSAYAIGLAEDDFFTQPFDVRPIELGPVIEPEKEELSPAEASQQAAAIFAALAKK